MEKHAYQKGKNMTHALFMLIRELVSPMHKMDGGNFTFLHNLALPRVKEENILEVKGNHLEGKYIMDWHAPLLVK